MAVALSVRILSMGLEMVGFGFGIRRHFSYLEGREEEEKRGRDPITYTNIYIQYTEHILSLEYTGKVF